MELIVDLNEVVVNIFCPTGPGGGIKPDCGGKGVEGGKTTDAGSSTIQFHGTSAIENILKEGLVPRGRGRVWDQKLMRGPRAKAVFVTPTIKSAQYWAAVAAYHLGGHPTILRVEIPSSVKLFRDTKTGGWYHKGPIPKEWITGYAKLTLKPNSPLEVESVGEFISVIHNVSANTVYIPITLLSLDVSAKL